MNRAELDQKIAEEEAVKGHQEAVLRVGLTVDPVALAHFRAGHAAGYRDGLAAGVDPAKLQELRDMWQRRATELKQEKVPDSQWYVTALQQVAGALDALLASQQTVATTPAANPIRINECPSCGANWTAVAEMLAERPCMPDYPRIEATMETENHAQARHIIQNCESCRRHFLTTDKNYTNPPKGD